MRFPLAGDEKLLVSASPLWLGPAGDHPYSPSYFAGGPGMNCLSWNMY